MINAYAAPAAGAPLERFAYDPGALGPHEVEVQISHCGLCHTDLHFIDGVPGLSSYPLVAGHEIVGVVTARGDRVRDLDLGQRVGTGSQAGACLECEWCRAGDEACCPAYRFTMVGRHGGLADAVRLDARFVYPIPDALPSHEAAPLLCAGVTMYTALVDAAAAGKRVGIVGIGGLGHLGLQIARALGCEVTAFTTSAAKAGDARGWGAAHVVETSDPAALAAARATQDVIVSTVSGDLPWPAYVEALRPRGDLIIAGASFGPLQVSPMQLFFAHRGIRGSHVGSRQRMREALAFAVEHDIRPRVERQPMAQVNQALDRLRANQARYRIVLEV